MRRPQLRRRVAAAPAAAASPILRAAKDVWVSFPPNAAQAVGLLENYDLVALGAERLGRGEAADAAADYRDAFTVRRHVERA